ncbi:hypothetical protein A2160_01340 [Candidatus Beckwithbacteria bacterium RBG_13_42_9]|uniref:Four helix bundle protein n=1 Tax=Candidatus Beckwithbacteria bacterium RBG_13_42_9 TaxID=1797457 RepID=A0A1F5E493_9BACT|nr:MAG: hypothetical protein A2160_01340 [Candidatus Beckwithbacteria bacterium RBG_13_42_9]
MDQEGRNIHERIFRFALLVLRFVRLIPQTIENKVIIHQLAKSVTSIGANSQEADGSESKKDFIHKFLIARKEAKETNYWIRLVCAHNCKNLELVNQGKKLFDEGEELVKIISAIVKNTRRTQ